MRDIRDESTNTTLIDHVALATFLRKLKNALSNTTATADSTHSDTPSVQVTFPNLNGGFNFDFSGLRGTTGEASRLHLKYASSVSGQPPVPSPSDMHNAPQSGDKYIGVNVDSNTTGPTSPSDYIWMQWKGDDGTSVKILGSYTSTNDLPSTGQELGDGYLINGYLWVYTGSEVSGSVNGFENVGQIQGPAGITYDPQIGTVTSGSTASASVEVSGSTATFSFVLPIGPTGATGPTGTTGPTGPTGYTESSINTHYMPTTGTTSIDLIDYEVVTDKTKETVSTYRLNGLDLDPRLHVISGKYDLIEISEKYNNRPHLPEIGWLIRRTTSYSEGDNIIAIPFYAIQENGNPLVEGYSRVENLGTKDMYRRGSVNLTAYIYDDQKLIETVNDPDSNFWPQEIKNALNGSFCGPTAAVDYLEHRYGLFGGGIITDNHIGLSERIELDYRNFWTIVNQDYTHRYEIGYLDRYKTGNPHNSLTRSKKRTNICVKKSAINRDERYNNPCNLLITDTCKNNICVNFDISDQLLAHDFFGQSWSGRIWEYEPKDYTQLNSFTFMFVQDGIVKNNDEYFEGGLDRSGDFVDYDAYEDDNYPKGWYYLYKLLETESQNAVRSSIDNILLFEQEQN